MVKILTEEDTKEDVASDTSSEVMLTVNVIEDNKSEETVDLIESTQDTTTGKVFFQAAGHRKNQKIYSLVLNPYCLDCAYCRFLHQIFSQ